MGELSREEIERCEQDPDARLTSLKRDVPELRRRTKGPRYTPIAKREEKPDAIAWLLRNYPTLKDSQIIKLIGTTRNTIQAIRSRSHWNMANIRARDPVLLGLCSQSDLDAAIAKAQASAEAKSASSEAKPKPAEPEASPASAYAIPEGLFKIWLRLAKIRRLGLGLVQYSAKRGGFSGDALTKPDFEPQQHLCLSSPSPVSSTSALGIGRGGIRPAALAQSAGSP